MFLTGNDPDAIHRDPRHLFFHPPLLRIAFVSTILGYPWGGADTLWTHAAEAAAKRGDTLFLGVSELLPGSERVAALRAQGATIHLQSRPSTGGKAGRLLRRLGLGSSNDEHLTRSLKRFRPDRVVVSQGGTYDLLLYPKLSSWLTASGTPFDVIANWQLEHPVLDMDSFDRIRTLFPLARTVHFVSSRNLSATRRHLLLPLENATVIQNPLRWTTEDASSFPAATPSRLATVSRLDHGKGIQMLLHAMADLPRDAANAELRIYGGGPYEAMLKRAVSALGLDKSVRFEGYVRSLHEIWQSNHMLVSASIEDGVPMTIPEAMLCGRPVLATCVGGAEDWIEPDRTGFLCPAPTVPLLSDTLRHAFSNRDRWHEMGLSAAQSASVRYRADDYLKLIN